MKKKLSAFTLAEVLTTLMVIGVVAALTIPALMQNIGGLEKQKTTFARKLEQGLHRMAVQDKLGRKHTTQSFVKELKNFFTITSVCDSNNLTKCFGEKIKNGEDEFEVANLKSAKDFNSEYPDAPVYGVLFNDGTSMLLAYKTNCRGYSSSDIPQEDDTKDHYKSQLALITSYTRGCLYYLYDVNGTKGDNTVGNDYDMMGTLVPTKSGSFGLSFEIIDNKMYSPGENDGNGHTYTCVNGMTNETNPYNVSCDYWTGAQKFCKEKGGRLASMENLAEIATKIYGVEISTWGSGEISSGASLADADLANALGIAQGNLWTWSNNPCGGSASDNGRFASMRYFTQTSSSSSSQAGEICAGRNANYPIICVK